MLMTTSNMIFFKVLNTFYAVKIFSTFNCFFSSAVPKENRQLTRIDSVS